MADENKTLKPVSYADIVSAHKKIKDEVMKTGVPKIVATQKSWMGSSDLIWDDNYSKEFIKSYDSSEKYQKYIFYNNFQFEPIPSKQTVTITKDTKEEVEMAVKKAPAKAAAQKNIDLQKAFLEGFATAKTSNLTNAGELYFLLQSIFPAPELLPELNTIYFYQKLPDEWCAMAVRYNPAPEVNTFEVAIRAHYYPIPGADVGDWKKVKFGPFYPIEAIDPKKSYDTFFYYVSHNISAFWMSTFLKNQDMFNQLKAHPFTNLTHDPIPDYVYKTWNALHPSQAPKPVNDEGTLIPVEGVTVGTTSTVDDIETFEVDSETEDKQYKVTINKTTNIHTCECKSYVFSKKKPKTCKHIKEVLDSMDFEDELAEIKTKLKEQKEEDDNSEIPK